MTSDSSLKSPAALGLLAAVYLEHARESGMEGGVRGQHRMALANFVRFVSDHGPTVTDEESAKATASLIEVLGAAYMSEVKAQGVAKNIVITTSRVLGKFTEWARIGARCRDSK